MTILVSRNDVQGTAALAARGASTHLEAARTSQVLDVANVDAAIADLVQALSETVYVRSCFGSVGSNVRDLESDGVQRACDWVAEKVLQAIDPDEVWKV